ncbi:MAG: LysR substrate-binding domain-containing protein, partial [Novosphingobium sp.]|nr:LysR substrate-binding domain-containing protein [Novosphingobium sp.]
ILASADVSLAPGPIETFCLAALESLAAGTPVVASNTSAVGGPRKNMNFRHIAVEELFVVGPAGKFGSLEDFPGLSFEEICSLQLILPGFPHSLRQLIDAEFIRHGSELHVFRELDALSHIPTLISDGYGYSILPLAAIADPLASGQVSIARIDGGSVRRTLALVRNSSAVVTQASLICEEVVLGVLTDLITQGVWQAVPEAGSSSKGGRGL